MTALQSHGVSFETRPAEAAGTHASCIAVAKQPGNAAVIQAGTNIALEHFRQDQVLNTAFDAAPEAGAVRRRSVMSRRKIGETRLTVRFNEVPHLRQRRGILA